MSSLPRLSSLLLNSDRTNDIYSSYKYEDIKSDWIIHQGYLEYSYGESLFKAALFRKYYIVLTCFVDETKENLVILFLYPQKTKSPYKYFQLEKNDQLNDRCRKLIEGKPGLFFLELIIYRTDRGEIFGAQSVPERKLWIEKFNEAIRKLGSRAVVRSVSDVPSSRLILTSEDPSFSGGSNSINYFKFEDRRSVDRPTHQSFAELSDAEYLEPIQDYVKTTADPSKASERFSWENIFYSNMKNDFAALLNKIGRTGTFLLRPSVSGDQLYTLCVYDDGHVYKFSIHESHDYRYQLIYRENQPKFDQITELCEYYTIHPLYITGKDGLRRIFI